MALRVVLDLYVPLPQQHRRRQGHGRAAAHGLEGRQDELRHGVVLAVLPDTVRHFGRTYELGVMAMFMARTGRVFTDVDLAPRILPKQKLPFKPHTIVGKDAVARIFKRFDEQRSAEGDK